MWKVNRPDGRPGPTVIVRMEEDNVGDRSFASVAPQQDSLARSFPNASAAPGPLHRGEKRKNRVGEILDAEQHLQINDLS
jgi:hypothetical protein